VKAYQEHEAIAAPAHFFTPDADEIWTAGKHPRNFWRIAYHAVYYGDFYLQPTAEAFVEWEDHREGAEELDESDPAGVPVLEPYGRDQLLAYLDRVDASVDEIVDRLDLDSEDSGFLW
jgi:hypothetical protein